MKKSLITALVVCVTAMSLFGCSKGASTPSSSKADVEKETPKIEEVEMNMTDFDALLKKLPVGVVSTKYVVQDEKLKSLYPDMLQAEIINNTEFDIKDAVVAIVAWDENNLPVKIKGNIDFNEGSYIKEINYDDINLVAKATFGEGFGYGIGETIKITSFKAIPVSFVTFEGETWSNPYYDEWKKMYEGNKFSDSLSVKVVLEESKHTLSKTESAPKSTSDNNGTSDISEADLKAQLDGQALKVVETKYTVQNEQYKNLYPDLLQAMIKNETQKDIKNAVVAFVAWDENKLPIKIKGNLDLSDSSYIKRVDYNDINLVPGKTFGNDVGYELDPNNNIKSFKAIVVSYEAFDGEKWENPLFKDWKKLYEGQKIN